jgi:hypothetical protein
MTFLNAVGDYYSNLKNIVVWNLRYGSPVTILDDIYNRILDQERGTEMPYYFPTTTKVVKQVLHSVITNSVSFVSLNESELDKHRKTQMTYYTRLGKFCKRFHSYSNDSMYNVHFYTKMTESEYHKVNTQYNNLFFLNLSYNALSGALILASSNHYFRSRKADLKTAFVASIPAFAALLVNYHISDGVKNYFINNSIRRLGYGQYTSSKWKHYSRNVEFSG